MSGPLLMYITFTQFTTKVPMAAACNAYCYSNYETYHIFLCLFVCTVYMRKQSKPICPTEWSTLFTKTTVAQSSLVM
jgi:hypothetical protein